MKLMTMEQGKPIARWQPLARFGRCGLRALAFLLLTGLLCGPLTAYGQEAAAEVAGQPEKLVDESFSFRQDEMLFQFEEAATLISTGLGKVADKVNVLAINSIYFGGEYRGDFRHKAKAIFLEKLLAANPATKLVRCQECEKLETKIVRGVLVVRKGLPNGEARRKLARSLGVDGFLDIGVFKEGSQITVYIQVVEAETGAILLVEELSGRPAFRRDSLTVSFGDIKFPITLSGAGGDHSGLAISGRETLMLSDRFSFGVDVSIYMDNNASNPDKVVDLSAGLKLAPFFGYDLLQFRESTTKVTGYFMLGKMLAPQFNYLTIYGMGVIVVVGDKMEILLGSNSYQDTTLNGSSAVLSGTGLELMFGYRF